MKLIFTCINIILSLLSNNLINNYESFAITENNYSEEEEIIIEENNNLLTKEYYNNETKMNIEDIYINDKYICSIDKSVNSFIYYNDKVLSTEINDDYVYINTYLLTGESETINLNIKANKTKLINSNNEYYYLLVEYNNDIYIYKLDINNNIIITKHLIGEGIELIEEVKIINNNIYLIYTKDDLASGDYGNGGINQTRNVGLFLLNNELEIIDNKSFESNEFINLELKNDNLLAISLNDAFYLYDTNLNQILGLKFASNCIFSKFMINELGIEFVIRFLKNGIEVYNLQLGKKVYEEGYSNNNDPLFITDFIERNDSYYGFNDNKKIIYNIKIYYIEDFVSENIYYEINDKPSNINNYVYSLNNKIERTKVKTIGEFDSNVTGNYITYYFYDDLELIGKTINYPFINVRDGLIYKTGYILESNMIMELNGEEISNNYELSKEGEYNIKYYIEDEFNYEVNIIIDNEASYIENQRYYLNEFDYYLNINENIRLEYNVNINDNEKIDSIVINNTEVDDFDTFDINENNIGLFVYLVAKNKGVNKYKVNYINIINNETNEKRILLINKTYYLYGLKEKTIYDLNINIDNNITINSNISDSDDTLKGIYINYYKNNNLVNKEIVNIENLEISLNKFKDIEIIEIGYVIDNNYKNLIYEEIINLKYNNLSSNDYLRINIVSKEESINELELVINKTNDLISASVDDDYIYKGNVYDYGLIIGLSLFLIIGSVAFGFIINKIKNKN